MTCLATGPRSFRIASSLRQPVLIGATLPALFLAGCGSDTTGPEGTDDPGSGLEPGAFTLETGAQLAQVAGGGALTFAVDAIVADATGQYVYERSDFTASTTGSCISVAQAATTVTVTALEEWCTQDVEVTSGGQTRTVTIETYDPYAFDLGGDLLMTYTDTTLYAGFDNGIGHFHNGDPTTGSGARGDTGWYPIGSYAVRDADASDVNGAVPHILLKDISIAQDRLAFPTDFTPICNLFCWFDGGNIALWQTVCPAGYVALGDVAWNETLGQPPLDSMVCVLQEYTTPATIDPVNLWNDNGTGGSIDVSMWRAGEGLPASHPTDVLSLAPSTGYLCLGNDNSALCDTDKFRRLLIPIPQSTEGGSDRTPLSSGPSWDSKEAFSASVRVPFSFMPSQDPLCADPVNVCNTALQRLKDNVNESPFYWLERLESYETISGLTNNSTTLTSELTYSRSNFWEQSEETSYKESTGLEVTVGGSANFGVGGGSIEVSVSQQFEWSSTVGSSYGGSETFTLSTSVPPRTWAAYVQLVTTWRGVSETGEVIDAQISAQVGPDPVLISWPLDGS